MQGGFETLYQLAFLSVALAIAIVERLHVVQRDAPYTSRRWTTNIGLFFIGSIAAAVVLPLGVYAFAKSRPPGLVSKLELSLAWQFVLAFLVLDMWKYWEHRVYHRFRPLWRLHLVHHSDTHVDVTTSERHHPFEVLLGTGTLIALIVALGLPAAALGAYLLTATIVALLSHGNLRLPAALDRTLRRVIVTPGFHAIHHSDHPSQTDSNYGAVLTVWDRLFGTHVDPTNARIRHFGLEYFHRPKDTSLPRVLLQPFLFRRDLDYPARSEAMQQERARPSPRFLGRRERMILLAGAVGSALALLAMWPAMLQLISVWSNSESYQFAWLVIPMFSYALWSRYQVSPDSMRLQPDFSGLPIVVAAMALWLAASLTDVNVGQQIAFVLALQGIAASTFGWRSYIRLFPIFGLLFLMIPINDLLIPGLRVLTLRSIEAVAAIANIPCRADGFVIYVGTHRYVVIDECSGTTYVTLGGFLAYAWGLLLYRSFAKTVALFVLGAGIGIASNVLRVNAIVLVDWLRNSQMDLAAHGAMQWLALFVGLGILFYVLTRLGAESTSSSAGNTTAANLTRLRMAAPVLLGASALLITGAASSVDRTSTTVQHLGASTFPERFREWVLVQQPGSWLPDGTGSNAFVEATYREQNRELRLLVLKTLAPTAKLQEAMLVPRDEVSWLQKNAERVHACVEGRCSSVVHATWQRPKSDHVRHVYFAYTVGNVITSSKLELRLAHGWQRLRGMGETSHLLALFVDQTPLDEGDIAAAFEAIRDGVSVQPNGDARPGR